MSFFICWQVSGINSALFSQQLMNDNESLVVSHPLWLFYLILISFWGALQDIWKTTASCASRLQWTFKCFSPSVFRQLGSADRSTFCEYFHLKQQTDHKIIKNTFSSIRIADSENYWMWKGCRNKCCSCEAVPTVLWGKVMSRYILTGMWLIQIDTSCTSCTPGRNRPLNVSIFKVSKACTATI